jgi:subfamily B ATP-binding cassette protein MsbA
VNILNDDIKLFFKRFLPYFKDYKKQLTISIVGMIMAASGAALSAYIIKPVLDKIFIQKDEQLLFILPFALVLIYAYKSIGKYLQIYYASYVGLDIVKRLRDEMLSKILSFEMDFFHKYRSGELISRSVNDVERVKLVVSNIVPHLVRESLVIIFLLGYIFYLNPKMALLSIIFLPLTASPLSKLAKKMKALSFTLQEKISNLTARLSEIFNNIEMIKANAVEEYEKDIFKTENELINKISKKAVRTSELVSPMMEIVGGIAAALIVYFGGREVIDGTMSVGSFFSFLAALFMLYTPIKRVSNLHNKMQDAIAASERIFSLIDRKTKIKDGKENLKKPIKEITFENINLSYGDKIALKNISFNVKKGESIALVGNSGGGKSSIVNLLLRFYDSQSGEIRFNNQNIKNLTMKDIRESISIVTQRVYIFNDSIAANVAYGQKIDEKKVIESLKQANALDFIEELEDGIYTNINEFGTNLSGGQRQRIAIARAIYRNPQILIFDEATSALDTKSEQKITDALKNISKNKITIIIAHRLKSIEHVNRIIVLKNGTISCVGNRSELLKQCDEFKHLNGLQR